MNIIIKTSRETTKFYFRPQTIIEFFVSYIECNIEKVLKIIYQKKDLTKFWANMRTPCIANFMQTLIKLWSNCVNRVRVNIHYWFSEMTLIALSIKYLSVKVILFLISYADFVIKLDFLLINGHITFHIKIFKLSSCRTKF